MSWVMILAIGGAIVAAVVYLGRERLGATGAGLALLRTVGLGALAFIFINPGRSERIAGGPVTVLLDASLSMSAEGAAPWSAALDTARALAGTNGTILRFGSSPVPFDTGAPVDGASRLGEALRAATGRGGPVYVVTDGEIDDAGAIPASLLSGVAFRVVGRDTIPDAAIVDVSLPQRVQRDDSLTATLVIATSGGLDSSGATLEITTGTRRLYRGSIVLPKSPGTARRTVSLGAGILANGTHVLRFVLTADGDREPRTNTRLRVVSVTAEPGIVAIADPADWESRFLVTELTRIAPTSARGYARITPDRWVDMRTLAPVRPSEIAAAVRGAGVAVIRGQWDDVPPGRAVWRWPAGSPGAEPASGDWYVGSVGVASPVGARLSGVSWDSLPPLLGVVTAPVESDAWVGLSARLGRRGAERAVLVGRDSAGTRRLVTLGSGLWRWALRGGASREAYRAVLAGGIDWLLGAEASALTRLTAGEVVSRGLPAVFRWRGSDRPDSLRVTLSGDSTRSVMLRFDPDGVALVSLEPGIHRWEAAPPSGAHGVIAVEEYSDEFRPRARTVQHADASGGMALAVMHARDRWWLFVVAIAAFVSEWAWRQRRGLP